VSDPHNLQRFVDAQEGVFDRALAELRAGEKQSHWMWFVFPQIAGLGRSPTAQYFALGSAEEARCYLQHPLLGARFRQAVEVLLSWRGRRSAEQILGPVDAIKLRSSLTLFDVIQPGAIFGETLGAFFDGTDERTLALLQQSE
jgi:uncharacterized protein (DUF1810 family)